MEKILLISKFNKMGGTRTFYNNLIEYCVHKNYKLYVLFTTDNIDDEQIKFLEDNNIEYKIFQFNKKSNILSYSLQYIKLLLIVNSRFVAKYNIEKVIFTQWDIITDFLSVFFNFFNIKLRYFIHSDAIYPQNYRPIFNIIKYIVSKMNNDNLFITVSKYNRQQIIDNWSIKEQNVKVLYNFSNLEPINYNSKNNDLIVLTLGHVIEYKNPKLWLKVAREVIKRGLDVKFIWAGEGELLNEFREETKNDPNIQFIGYIKDVGSIYEKADLYLQLSKKETQGISVLDAMKNSIPPIVSNRGGLPESVVNNYSGYIVDINRVDPIVEKVCELLMNREKRITMGANSYKIYKDKFTKERWYNQLDQIL